MRPSVSPQAATLVLGKQRLSIWTLWALRCLPQCWTLQETVPKRYRGAAPPASPSSRWTSPSHSKSNRRCWTPRPSWVSKVKTEAEFAVSESHKLYFGPNLYFINLFNLLLIWLSWTLPITICLSHIFNKGDRCANLFTASRWKHGFELRSLTVSWPANWEQNMRSCDSSTCKRVSANYRLFL